SARQTAAACRASMIWTCRPCKPVLADAQKNRMPKRHAQLQFENSRAHDTRQQTGGSMAQLNIGDYAIDCVVDLERPFLHAQTFFPDLTDDMFAHCRKVLPPGDLTPDGR